MAPDTPQEERRRRLSGKRQETEEVLPTPPDGGWGWMVVLGSFIIHVIADGVAYSFGIFYIEFLEYFGAGRGPTGWIGSLMVGITWGSGLSMFLYKFDIVTNSEKLQVAPTKAMFCQDPNHAQDVCRLTDFIPK